MTENMVESAAPPTFAIPFPGPGASYLQCARRHTSLASLFYRYRRTFDLPAAPASAVLRITGCSQYAVYVNGAFVNRGPLVSGREMMTVDQFDVAHLLKQGGNVVAVHLHYYTVGHFRLDIAGWQGAGLLADLVVDGQVVWVSDGKWKADVDWAYEPNTSKRSDWMPLLEVFDAGRAEDWTAAGYDDSAWRAANPAGVGVPGIKRYEPRPGGGFTFEFDDRFAVASSGRVKFKGRPDDFYWFADHSLYEPVAGESPVRAGGGLSDVVVPLDEAAFTHVRLEAESYVLGRPELTVTAPPGVVIDLVWGERMRPGDVLLDPTERMSNWARYITRGGRQTFTLWSLLGFKQLELVIHPKPGGETVRFERIGAQRQWTMRCDRGSFTASDDRYTRLWRAGAHTAAVVTADHHCDNTFREHQPWSGDQEWTKMGVYVAEGIHPITERQLAQFPLGQKRDGRFISPYPSAFPFMHTDKQASVFEDLPDHAAGYIHSLWRHYWYSGHVELLKQVWPALRKQAEFWREHRDGNGLVDLGQLVDSWVWVDWLGLKDKSAPLNGVIGCALWAMVRIARAIGADDRPHVEQWREHRDAFVRAFWSEDAMLFIDRPLHRPELGEHRSQLSNAFAVCADMLPVTADRSRVAQALTALDGRLGVASPPMQAWVFTAMELLDADDRVHHLIERQWLTRQILDEMGTVPEFWEDTPGRKIRSLAQGGSPFIAWALTHYVLGVRPAAPGFARFIIKPTPHDLTSCAGTIPTIRGPLTVRWRRDGDKLDIHVDAPEGCVRDDA